jgi:signal recognition particle receptor subunit beta
MRIGEIAILGPDIKSKQLFIEAVCDEIFLQTDRLILGRLKINDQLIVHLYGLDLSEKDINFAWDLVSKKLLGYVVLFNWNNADSLASAKSMIDFLNSRYNIPLVIAANMEQGSNPVPEKLLDIEFDISDQSQFTFCRLSEPKSVRNVLIILINSIIDRVN